MLSYNFKKSRATESSVLTDIHAMTQRIKQDVLFCGKLTKKPTYVGFFLF